MLAVLRFITLLLAVLGLSLGAAHVLEMPVKMGYDADTYAAVTSTLYRYFGLVGGPIQVAAAVAAIVLAVLLRGKPGFGAVAIGAACLAVSLILWATLVQPVNNAWSAAIAESHAVADAYARLRGRWEYGHVAAFVAWLAGVIALLTSPPPGPSVRRAH